jgi:formylglycine-generating enzyme required for sulfatase activity
MKRGIVLVMIIMSLVFVFSGCDALRGFLTPEPVEIIVEEEAGKFKISKVGGSSERTEEETAVFSWAMEDPGRQIVNYQFRKDGGEWTDHALNTSYTWSGYSEGAHTFEVRAQDNKGAYSEAVEWNFTYSTGTMVLVEGGTFMMGDEFGDLGGGCRPVHEVTLTYDFYMGKYETTFDEYDAFCEATGRSKPNDQGWGRGQRPVIWVSWWDAVAYCSWLSEKEGIPKAYDDEGNLLDKDGRITTDPSKVVGYRLPTEAEWEYAARGGNKSRGYEYAGSDNVGDVAWYIWNSGWKTQEVGKKAANELGLYDMSGNVWERCSDWYGNYSSSAQTNPYNSTAGSRRVLRGGGWVDFATLTRVAFRILVSPSVRLFDIGFRICRTVP